MRRVYTIGATRYVKLSGMGVRLIFQNDIPVFCPALTDGSLGDMIYFHTYKTETQLSIDIVQDIRRLNDMSVKAKQAGMIILGGGVCKHQIANAMLFVSLSFLPSNRE
jgi:deoxyhypusine synthase